MAITLPDARLLSDDEIETLRLRAIHGCELGYTQAEIASILGVARETVSRWWTAYVKGGVDELPSDRSGRPVGSGRTLTDMQAEHIQYLINNFTPDQLHIPSTLWTRRAIRELIYNEYQIWMPIRTVGEYLRRWGYTPKKPRRHAKKQDPAEVREWLDETFPNLEKQALDEGATIYWCDETGVAGDAHPGRGYAPVGETPMMDVPDPHIRMNMISSIANDGELRFMTYGGGMTGKMFVNFLGRLVRGTAEKVILVADRLRAHGSARVRKWLTSHADRIELAKLPRRSPELNPVEYLNNDLKCGVNESGMPSNQGELRERIQRFMHWLGQRPAHVMSYFSHPEVRYAAGEIM